MECDFGCKKQANFLLKNGRQCCERSANSCPNMIELNRQGVKSAWALGKMESPNRKGHVSCWKGIHKISNADIFTYPSEHEGEVVKTRYQQIRNYFCDNCGVKEWQNKKIVLDLHHINGDRTDNRLDNLQLLCPNCHSITDNYKGRNIQTGVKIVSDENLLIALRTSKNIRKALLKVGLAPKGGNYFRAKKLIGEMAEKEDAKVLKTFGANREGSIPSLPIAVESDQEHKYAN